MTREYLLFRLSGPMAAFGDITVGERRSLWDAPSKSGVLGLVAGAMGFTRDDHDALLDLDATLGFAVRLDSPGYPLRDYHTAQTPTEAARKRLHKAGASTSTRKNDLVADDLNTVLSERMYRLESVSTVALWQKPDQNADLTRVEAALKRPVFAPYLGRKACPLSAPPRPRRLTCDRLLTGFGAYDAVEEVTRLALKTPRLDSARVWFEFEAGLTVEEADAKEIRLRRDGLRNRALWQFSDRREGRLEWSDIPVGTAAEDAA
ncbi:type I-E CRISPR-associated protein Cas5/CasD [Asticcacaulis sp. AC402]|uniref:type I-E CRISPR-associated protein Cas5/CasD n=1 Tax=Asticcacaulis sp. AC402 TaxID=1282361 RepID=UPI0003C3B7F7|nr:type I-E CRISPR-associated protein Cas5/CasD [Asticcacaulis sp. AC402]ESQ74767.1 hypothetical protein ABAC402_12745 [Asticcacaulis sp. AC402]